MARTWWLIAAWGCAPEEESPATSFSGESADGALAYVLAFGAPPVVGPVEVTVTVSDDAGPVTGAALAVDPFMPEHGHGPSEPPVIEELGDGEYSAAWTFPMAGAWELTTTVDGVHPWVADVVVD